MNDKLRDDEAKKYACDIDVNTAISLIQQESFKAGWDAGSHAGYEIARNDVDDFHFDNNILRAENARLREAIKRIGDAPFIEVADLVAAALDGK